MYSFFFTCLQHEFMHFLISEMCNVVHHFEIFAYESLATFVLSRNDPKLLLIDGCRHNNPCMLIFIYPATHHCEHSLEHTWPHGGCRHCCDGSDADVAACKKARAKAAACCDDHADGDKGGNDGADAAGTGIKFQVVNASGGQCQASNIHGQGGQQQQ